MGQVPTGTSRPRWKPSSTSRATANCLPQPSRSRARFDKPSDVVEYGFGQHDVVTQVAVFDVPWERGRQRKRVADHPAEPAVELALTQQPDRADELAAQQHPIR